MENLNHMSNKYSFFYNEEGNYTVVHKENGIETYIAITDNAEKADFITKACNKLHSDEHDRSITNSGSNRKA